MKKSITVGANLAIIAACAMLALVVAARGGAGTQNTNSSATQGNANDHAGMKHDSMKMTADQKFAMEAAMGGMMEVELGRIAAQKGASEEVRQFGQKMVDDHTKAGDELKQIADGKGMMLPTAVDAKHQMEMQKLSALSGEKFDKEYVKMQVKGHKEMAAMFQKEASGGMDAELKSFASSTLPTVQEHWQMAQRINDKMMMRKSGNLKSTNSNGNSNSNM